LLIVLLLLHVGWHLVALLLLLQHADWWYLQTRPTAALQAC
jgi:hypothetical protein